MLYLLIEFFDELAFGVQGAVLPVMRAELALSYAQVGLLLGVPAALSTVIEPVVLLLGDTGLRKRLVIAGGVLLGLSMLLLAGAHTFAAVLLAFALSYPASGAFVTLSQATLMDEQPGREAQAMARWTLAGSLGNLIGPLVVAAALSLALGWRPAFAGLAALALALTLAALFRPFSAHRRPKGAGDPPGPGGLQAILANLKAALSNPRLLRWVVLLQFSDLLLDVLIGYAPLYLTDVIGVSAAQAGLLLSALMLTSLAADAALIPLLERVPGRAVVRASAAVAALLYVALLLAPWPAVKIALLVAVRFSTLGWYSVLQGEAYAAAPGRSGTVMAVTSAAGLAGSALVWLVGWMAEQAGLPAAMWLLLLGPICLVLFVPRPAASNAKMTAGA